MGRPDFDDDSDCETNANAASYHGTVRDPEVWQDHWSEELVTLWHGLKDHCDMMGVPVLDRCDFPAFATFCWQHSSRMPPRF